jgi:ankyrin repeat protein
MSELHQFCLEGNFQGVQELIANRGINIINEKGNCGRISLHFAASNVDLEIIEILIQNMGNCNEQDEYGWTPLHFASYNGHLKIVNKLLSYSEPFIKNNKGETAADIALTKEIRDLIDTHWDLEIKEPDDALNY